MLESFRLRVFREVAQQLSFRRAAEVLYISQPAVTQHIKALEADLGQRLLDREGRRVSLTEAGATLLSFAERSQTLLREAAESLARLQGRLEGNLTLAASTTIAQYILPRLLATFAARWPEVLLSLESVNTEQVVESVAAGRVDLGLIEGPAHRPDLLLEPWLTDELLLAVPARHPWAGEPMSAADLQHTGLLMREQGSGTRAVIEEAFRSAGVPPESLPIRMELGSTEALLGCVEAGLGIGFASRFSLRRQRRLGTLAAVRLRDVRITRDLQLLRRRGPFTSPAAGAFHTHLQEFAQRRALRRAMGKP